MAALVNWDDFHWRNKYSKTSGIRRKDRVLMINVVKFRWNCIIGERAESMVSKSSVGGLCHLPKVSSYKVLGFVTPLSPAVSS